MTPFDLGYGHGKSLDRSPNPYAAGTADHEHYARGYAEGAAASGATHGQRLLPCREPRALWPFEVELLRRDLQEAVSPR
jgi:hypothetical protein